MYSLRVRIAIWLVVIIALGTVGFATYLAADALGGFAYALWAAAGLLAGGFVYFALRPPPKDVWSDRREALEQREQALEQKIAMYHQWMEFPQPEDLTGDVPAFPRIPLPSETSDHARARLVELDRQLLELLERETEILYENIRGNRYGNDGGFRWELARDDLQELVTKVARIYQPAAEQPLLETSLTQVLRAISRAALQLMVVLDQLPVKVQDQSFRNLYLYVRRAVELYGAYQLARPYFPWMRAGYQLGRVALGATPVSAATWWVLGSLSARGATLLTNKLIDRQALAFLQSLVRIVGFEVAQIYGQEFRQRDPNWIFGVEVAELVRHVPPSGDGLALVMNEVAALQLRSEYDRIFLFRCLASQKSAGADRYAATDLLTPLQRRELAQRLERLRDALLANAALEPAAAARLRKWQSAVTDRLQVQLADWGEVHAPPANEQRRAALRSLAGYLLELKQQEPEALAAQLAATQVLHQYPAEEQAAALADLRSDPPFYFEFPPLEPAGELAAAYLNDLADLACASPPRGGVADQVLLEAAVYLRRDPHEFEQQLNERYRSQLQTHLHTSVPRNLPGNISRAALDMLEVVGSPSFLYSPIELQEETSPQLAERFPPEDLWLFAAGSQIVLMQSAPRPRLVWQSDAAISIQRRTHMLGAVAEIQGGTWMVDLPVSTRIVVSRLWLGASRSLEPLWSFAAGRPAPDAAPPDAASPAPPSDAG